MARTLTTAALDVNLLLELVPKPPLPVPQSTLPPLLVPQLHLEWRLATTVLVVARSTPHVKTVSSVTAALNGDSVVLRRHTAVKAVNPSTEVVREVDILDSFVRI